MLFRRLSHPEGRTRYVNDNGSYEILGDQKQLIKLIRPRIVQRKKRTQTKLGFPRKIVILLMVQKSCHQLRSVVEIPLVVKVLAPPKRWLALGFPNHQQYYHILWSYTHLFGPKKTCSTATCRGHPLTSPRQPPKLPTFTLDALKPLMPLPARFSRRRQLPMTKQRCEAEGRKWSTTRKRKVGALH